MFAVLLRSEISNPAVHAFPVLSCDRVIHPLKLATAVHSLTVSLFVDGDVQTHKLPVLDNPATSVAQTNAERNFQEPAFFHLFNIEVSEPLTSSVSTKAPQTCAKIVLFLMFQAISEALPLATTVHGFISVV